MLIAEETFPTHSVLVNAALACPIIPLGFLESIRGEQNHRFVGPIPVDHWTQIYDHTIMTAVCDAALCLRPFVRLENPQDQTLLDRIARNGRLRVKMDGHQVLDDVPAGTHLVGFDGHWLRPEAFRFHAPTSHRSVFGVGVCVEVSAVKSKLPETDPARGVFVANDTRITIWLSGVDLKKGDAITSSAGIIAARYSTKLPTRQA